MFTHKLTKLLFTALTVLCIGGLFTACEKSDDETKTDPTAGGKTTEQQEVEMSDMDNFIEMSLKMEKMRLLFVKFFSNNWEGDANFKVHNMTFEKCFFCIFHFFSLNLPADRVRNEFDTAVFG